MAEAAQDDRTYTLDFADGRCRLAEGHGLEAAKADALRASETTHTPCVVLLNDKPWGRVGRTVWAPDPASTEKPGERPNIWQWRIEDDC